MLRDGAEAGDFTVDGSRLHGQRPVDAGPGAMHLARIRVGVRSLAPGIPGLFAVEPEQVVRTCIDSALANVRTERG